MKLTQRSSKSVSSLDVTIPPTFSCLTESSNSLDLLLNSYIIYTDDAESTTLASRRSYYLEEFNSWYNAFQAYLGKHALSFRQLQHARVLQLIQTWFVLIVQVTSDNGEFSEMAVDDHPMLYRRVLSLARDIISAQTTVQFTSKPDPQFAFDMNVVAPLYGLVHHCRDPVVRREAVGLLKTVKRREGIWDSDLAAIVGQKIIEIEEQGLGAVNQASDVPHSARIAAVQVNFDMEGKLGKICYSRGISGGAQTRRAQPQCTEIMSW